MKRKYSEVLIDSGICKGCGMCTIVCPKGVLKLNKNNGGGYKSTTVWSSKCIGCGNCAAICTTNAIEVNNYNMLPAM